MSNWSEWKENVKEINYNDCGVYKIRIVKSDGTPFVIPRFLFENPDQKGILQIGHSIHIEDRIKAFFGAQDGGEHPHATGQRLYLIWKFTDFKQQYKGYKIQYSFLKLKNNKIKPKEMEERLLKCYFKKHGEVPPLNHNLPKQDEDWENFNCKYYKI